VEFYDFPGLENSLLKFHDFLWISRMHGNLVDCYDNDQLSTYVGVQQISDAKCWRHTSVHFQQQNRLDTGAMEKRWHYSDAKERQQYSSLAKQQQIILYQLHT